jgi:hypothetical protein
MVVELLVKVPATYVLMEAGLWVYFPPRNCPRLSG